MGLRARLIILILLAAVPVLIIDFIHEMQFREARSIRILDNAQVLAGLTAARQDRLVEGARMLLTATSQLQSIREKNSEECGRQLQEIVKQVPELTAMAVLSATTGDRWCVSLVAGPGGLNLADREYFQATIRSGTMQSSDYIVGRQTGRGSVVFTYPVRGASEIIESVGFLAYSTDVLSAMLNDPPLPEGAFVVLLGSDGVVAARWPDPEKWIGKNLSLSEEARRAMTERRGGVRGEAAWAGTGEYAVAFAPMRPPANLTVLVGLPITVALRESELIFWRELGLMVLVFVLAALAAIVGAHLLVVRPLHELQNSVDALARGDVGLRSSNPVRGSKELRSLAERFETMSRALEHRQSQLVEALQQKELLLKEVNHRVKNSLQFVASLLNLQRSNITDADARLQFDEAGRRIFTVAQIHQRLYEDENVDRVAVDRLLPELCSDLNKVMGNNGKVSLLCEAAPSQLPTDQMIPVALILNELITNAFKYSYPGDKGGVIRVTSHSEGDALVLTVTDDGVPLPKDFDPAKSNGLGMKMIGALSKQLGAALQVIALSPGKSFVLRVPIRSREKN